MARKRLIRASEVGEYAYCQRAWWLQHVVGEEPAGHQRRKRGQALHRRHGRQVWAAQALLIVSLLLAGMAALLLVAG